MMERAPGARTVINGREVDYFSGCGYFDLQGHAELIEAACAAVKRYGISSATSPLVYGNNPVLNQVITNATRFFDTEDILYYASGYLGNAILLDGLKDRYDSIFVDRESHYSVLHAASIVDKPVFTFAYMDADDLQKKIKKHLKAGQRPLVICDGIFPISGEISPVLDYRQVLSRFEEAIICVDDAHATGVIGENGRGTFEYFGIETKGENLYSSGTLSKALGGHGGIIAGSAELIKKLNENSSIPHAASLPPIPVAAATAKGLEILYRQPELRKKLWANVLYTKNRLRNLGFQINDSPVPIICLHSREEIDFLTLQSRLFDRGLAVIYLPGGRYTSVPLGGAIRISIFSSHTREQLDHLTDNIGQLI